MIEEDKSSEDITCPITSSAGVYCPFGVCHPLYGSNIGISPFSRDINLAISTIKSDIKKLNEEAREIKILKSELLSCQDRIFQKYNSLQNAWKDSGSDDHCISIGPDSTDNNKLLGLIRSDMERIKDKAADITILKYEQWSYQITISQKINSLQKSASDHG